MGIVVIGAIFVDIKGYPEDAYIPAGRNVGRVEQIHGGVGRNVAEDVANCELRPTFVSLVDRSGTGEDVLRKLKSHKVNVDYIRKTSNGIGTWLAVFNNEGDVVASISKRPDLSPIADTRFSARQTASSLRLIWKRKSSSGCSGWRTSITKKFLRWFPI